jgi:hypothetical protein
VTLETGSDPDIVVAPVRYFGPDEFRHEVRWLNQQCYAGCRAEYFVGSADGYFTQVASDTSRVHFKVCPTSE